MTTEHPAGDRIEGDWYMVPLNQITDPPKGVYRTEVLLRHHWLVDDEDMVRFWLRAGAFSPQANVDGRICAPLMARPTYSWAVRSELIPVAFLPQRPSRAEIKRAGRTEGPR